MLRKILLPAKLGCIPALILGFMDSLERIRDNDYVGCHLYNTAAQIIIGNINQYILLTLGAVYLIFGLYWAGGFLRGYLRIAFRTAAVSAVLTEALVALGYRELLLQAYQNVESVVRGYGSRDFILVLVSEGLWQLIAGIPLVIVGLILMKRLRSDWSKTACSKQRKVRSGMPTLNGRFTRTGLSVLLLVVEGWFLVALLSYGAFGLLYVRNAIAVKRCPNVVFIMVDTLRADHVGCYGYDRNTTPNIDRLARESIRFERAVAQASWTTWSVGSFMTSRYPQSLNLGIVSNPGPLDAKLLTLPEMLKDYGYKTGAVIANPNAGRGLNFDQGYDYFEQTEGFTDVSSPGLLSSALKWLSKAKNERFFLFLLFMDPHNPYINHDEHDFYPDYGGAVPNNFSPDVHAYLRKEYSEEDMRRMLAVYDSEIRFTDRYIGTLMDALKQHGIYDDTLIVFVSDHGEEFAEHNAFNHVETLYNELLDVPLIIKLPGENRERVAKGTFPLIDLFPSILGALHIKSSALPLLGKDVGLRTVESCDDQHIFSATQYTDSQRHIDRDLRSVSKSKYKYIVNLNSHEEELYDLEKDPRETRNLANSAPKIRDNLRETLLAHEKREMTDEKTSQKTPTNRLTEEEKRKLESLGYL